MRQLTWGCSNGGIDPVSSEHCLPCDICSPIAALSFLSRPFFSSIIFLLLRVDHAFSLFLELNWCSRWFGSFIAHGTVRTSLILPHPHICDFYSSISTFQPFIFQPWLQASAIVRYFLDQILFERYFSIKYLSTKPLAACTSPFSHRPFDSTWFSFPIRFSLHRRRYTISGHFSYYLGFGFVFSKILKFSVEE